MTHEGFVEVVQTSKPSRGARYAARGRAPSRDATPDGDLVINGWATLDVETTDRNEACEKAREFADRHGLFFTDAADGRF